MNNARLFIDLPVEPAVAKQIFKEFDKLDLPWSKLKTTKVNQLHITLKFLGDTSLEKIPEIINVLDSIDFKAENLELEINKPLVFNNNNPRVLTLGLKDNKDLVKLFNSIDQVLYDAGLAHKETRRFTAHLTLARVKQAAKLEEFNDFVKWNIQTFFSPTYFELQESKLTKLGPDYTVLQTFDL